MLNNGQYEKALPIFEGLVTEYPDNTMYRYNRAVTYFNLKKYKAALNDYLILINSDPTKAEYYFQAGNLYETQDSLHKVEYYYSKALARETENFMYYFKRGTFYLKRGLYEKAIKDFDNSILINEKHHNSYHNRAIALDKKGEKVQACDDWCQALLLGNPHSATHLDKNCKKYPDPCLLPK